MQQGANLPGETSQAVTIGMSALYLVLAIVQFARHRRETAEVLRHGLVTPLSKVQSE